MGCMKIELTLSKRQLDVLLSAIETRLLTDFEGDEPCRGPALIDALQDQPEATVNDYDIDMLAPTYRALVALWKDPDTIPSQEHAFQRRHGRKVREDRQIDAVLAAAFAKAAQMPAS